jgi:hypothetical protein
MFHHQLQYQWVHTLLQLVLEDLLQQMVETQLSLAILVMEEVVVETGLMVQVLLADAVEVDPVKVVLVQQVTKDLLEQLEEGKIHVAEVVEVWDKQEDSQMVEMLVRVEMACSIQ